MTKAKISLLHDPNEPIHPFAIKQAVVAVGLSKSDEALLDYLDFFTQHIPMEQAAFLHVLPRFDLFNALFQNEGESMVSNYELNEETIQEMKTAANKRLSKHHIKNIDFKVREGNPLEELVALAERTEADLTVIGQQSAASQHGILARNLARKVKCNALIVPDRARQQLKKIVVPIDFSPASIQILRLAIGINKQLAEPAEIICLNVYEMPSVASVYIRKSTEELQKIVEEDRMEAFRNFLRTYAGTEAGRIRTVLIENKLGDIGTYIMDYAEEEGADLILIGAKGHSRVELLLLGSVTERLLSENDSIPTLVVK